MQDRTGGGMMSARVCTAVCFAALVSTMSIVVHGLPILGPDLSICMPKIPKSGTAAVDCCVIDKGASIKDFKFNLDLPMRVRRPIHKVDDDFVRKYERAVGLMKALPPEDPRSYEGQWRLHCAYTGLYNQLNSTQVFDVHSSWLVIPFHRWFLYFHELILASLIGDDTFAIPYWAWDLQGENNPPANIMPPIYTNKNSSLYHEKRSKAHQDHGRVNLDFNLFPPKPEHKDPAVLLQDNLYTMWRTMVGDVKTPEDFYGRKLSLGESPYEIEQGVFPGGPHFSVHMWVGDETWGGEDMAPPYSAARDPIFFAHHAQVDRLWSMWKSWGGKDFSDPDWLRTEFLLYDENADLVRVNVRDSLNNDNFRVTYEQLDPDWLDYTPRSIREIDPKYAPAGILRRIWRNVVEPETYRTIAMAVGSYFQLRKNSAEVSLGGVRRTVRTSRVSRPEVLRSSDASSVYDEVLVITGVVEKPFDVNVVFDMFLELPEADENTPHHCVEFLGSVKAEAEGLRVGVDPIVTRKFMKTTSIRERLQILDRDLCQKWVTVTFVPAWDPKDDSDVSVRVTDLKVEMKLAR